MIRLSKEELLNKINDLEERLAESEQLVHAISNGEVDAFAVAGNGEHEVYTLQTGDYAYRLLIEESGEGAVNVTEEGLIVYTNAGFCNLIKRSYANIVGWNIAEFIKTESIQDFKRLFQTALTGRSKGEIVLFNGTNDIPVYISLTSLKPKLATVGIIISDLTERKKNEKVILQYQQELEKRNMELLQSNAELASFAYIASHDLKEPLRKVRTFSNMILDRDADSLSPKSKGNFERILNAGNRMGQLIDDLLNYSSLSAGQTPFVDADTNELLLELLEDLKEQITETGAVIHADHLPVMRVIPHQFIQLISNLILNAIKFRKTGTAPVINIRSEKSANDWILKVQDNGIGFEAEYAEKIFEVFKRLHGHSDYEGTGIGLAICRKIVQNHGGTIRAEGHPHVGATFIISLPRVGDGGQAISPGQ